jgi:hypothetical protein
MKKIFGGRQLRWSRRWRAMKDGGAMKERWPVMRQAMCCLSRGRHCLDDDTKIYPTESVYKPTLIGFDYVKRERAMSKLMVIRFLDG